MTNYPFDMQLVIDAVTLSTVANGQVFIYDADDASNSTPLTLTDPNGLPMSQPLMSSNNAFIPAFITTSPQVKWAGAGFSGFFDSYVGLRDVALEAVAAATAALIPAEAAVAAASSSAASASAAAASAAAAAIAGGSTSNIALDTDGVPYFIA